jgi:drug/metabolite transporter (DMT)-like permease
VNGAKLLGIALIVLGVIALTYYGMTYRSLPKANLYEPVPVPKRTKRLHPAVDSVALPAVGALALLGGVAILLTAPEREPRFK